MKSKDFIKEISGLSVAELKAKAEKLAEELMKLRFRNAAGQYEQTHRFQEIRRNLARVQTTITKLVTKQDVAQA